MLRWVVRLAPPRPTNLRSQLCSGSPPALALAMYRSSAPGQACARATALDRSECASSALVTTRPGMVKPAALASTGG
ncbi:Uncharacterised protein [Mycobacteroides abscessus subsp. abscessus]|nr:Uncharacterised protein [Mycobacteroides abscessus subsp. abscessus]